MKKFLLLSLLLSIILFTCGFSIKEWRNSIYDQIKAEAEKSFSALFNRRVTIERAGGIVLGQIDLFGMNIPELGRASKVVLSYNPIKYAFAKGDMIPALSKITVIEGNFKVARDRNGRWNVLSQETTGPAPVPAFTGRLILKNCRVEYLDRLGFRPTPQVFEVSAEKVNGAIDLRKKDIAKFSLSAKGPEPVKAHGSFNLKTGNYELTVSASALDLAKWGDYTVPLAGFHASGGRADVFLKVSPPKTKGWAASLIGEFTLHDATGRFQDYTVSKASGKLFMADERLTFKEVKAEFGHPAFSARGTADVIIDIQEKGPRIEGTADISLYRGTASVKVGLQHSALKLSARFSRIDLAALAQNAPGVEGFADGSIEFSGESGRISANLQQALAFGQPMDRIAADFKIKDNTFLLEKLKASSGNASFSANGKIDRQLNFDLQTEAAGLRLAGKGVFGKMQVTLNRFGGKVGGKIDQEFLASPLKKLYAQGEVILSKGEVGEQTFDQARGKINIGGGKIRIEDTFIQNHKSTLQISGQTGLGHSTELKLSGNEINFEDLKILNYFLPAEAQNPKGTISLEVEVTGFLSLEANLDSILGLSAKGKLRLSNCFMAEIPISGAGLNFSWQDRALSITDCQLKLPDSILTLSFESRKDGSISGKIRGTAELSRLQTLLAKYGKISGQLGIGLQIDGKLEEPNLTASLWIERFSLNELNFDKVSGSLNFHRGRLVLLEPALFQKGADRYSLAGKALISPENPDESFLDLDLSILRADLGSAYRLYRRLQEEFMRRFALPASAGTPSTKTRITLSGLKLPDYRQFARGDGIKIYSANGEKNFFLKSFGAIRRDFEKKLAAAPEENMGGDLSGKFKLSGKIKNLSGSFKGAIAKGYFRNVGFDEFSGSATLKNQEIKIEKALLTKGGGNLSARGDFNFNGNIFLHLVANSMPLDIIQFFFPNKEFKGNFNMNAGLDGTIQNPRIALAATASSVTVAGLKFDKIILSATKKEKNFYLHELSVLQGGTLSRANGSVLLAYPGRIDLEAEMKGNSVGLLNLFTDELKWIKGESYVLAKVEGTLENPEISGNIKITDGTVYVRSVDSELRNLQGIASIESNLLKIPALTGFLVGRKTRDLPNALGLAGNIDLSKMLAEKSMVDLDLVFSPTHLYLLIPNLYAGHLYLKELSLRGPLYFDFSQGPALKGKAEIDDAVITLSQAGSAAGKVLPLNFDLDVNLKKNVYAVMGDIATLNLSNIFMNLEIASEGALKVSGDLKYPSLLGRIAVKRGTVNIFNREFMLLAPEIQERYFLSDPTRVEKNVAVFHGEEGPAGIMPEVNMTTSVNVENQEKDVGGNYVKKKVVVLARLKGTIGAKNEMEAVKINLFGFTEDKTKTPVEIVPAAYSEQDLKVMLLPDFIKSLAGIGRPEEKTQVDSNVVVADYLSSRVQTLLFRGLEREVEQKLGLESLTLEYNLGPKFREAMGIKDVKGFDEDKPAWSVGFVKGFFDRLYIDVRYSQGMDQASAASGANTNFNYQLTYKLSPIWSIIYYREPLSVAEPTTGYQKITLKAGLSLW